MGGALYVDGGGSVFIADSVFTSNRADGYYGGALFITRGELTITNSIFTRNKGNDGGAMALMGVNAVKIIKSSIISYNIATGLGGGVYYLGGNDITIEDITIKENTAGNDGGGLYVRDAKVTIADTWFISN